MDSAGMLKLAQLALSKQPDLRIVLIVRPERVEAIREHVVKAQMPTPRVQLVDPAILVIAFGAETMGKRFDLVVIDDLLHEIDKDWFDKSVRTRMTSGASLLNISELESL